MKSDAEVKFKTPRYLELVFSSEQVSVWRVQVNAHIFPAQRGVAVFTVDVGHRVKSCEQQPLLSRTTADVHPEDKHSAVK